MTPDHYAKFIESLKVTKASDTRMYGLRLDAPWPVVEDSDLDSYELNCYLQERCVRAESNAKSPDLAEQVKGFMRAGMDAAYDMAADYESGREQTIVDYEAFRRLSEATEVKP